MFKRDYMELMQSIVKCFNHNNFNSIELQHQLNDIKEDNIVLSKENERIYGCLDYTDKLNILTCFVLLFPQDRFNDLLTLLIKKYREYECIENYSIYEQFFNIERFSFVFTRETDYEYLFIERLGFTLYIFINYIFQQSENDYQQLLQRFQLSTLKQKCLETLFNDAIFYKEMLEDDFCLFKSFDIQVQYTVTTIYKKFQLHIDTFFSKMFKYVFLIHQVIQVCQYRIYKDFGFKRSVSPNMFNHFTFFMRTLKYILYLKNTQYQKTINNEEAPHQLLTDDDLNSLQLGVNLNTVIKNDISTAIKNDNTSIYQEIISNPQVVYIWIPYIYDMCIKNEIYIETYIKPIQELNGLIVESQVVFPKDTCLKCEYDILMDDLVQFECGHQYCQSCFINYFQTHYSSILQQSIENSITLKCQWCQKRSKQVFVPEDTKNYLIRYLPTIQRLNHIYKHSISKRILTICDNLGYNVLQQKYNIHNKTFKKQSITTIISTQDEMIGLVN